jgi:hypothetical protein
MSDPLSIGKEDRSLLYDSVYSGTQSKTNIELFPLSVLDTLGKLLAKLAVDETMRERRDLGLVIVELLPTPPD